MCEAVKGEGRREGALGIVGWLSVCLVRRERLKNYLCSYAAGRSSCRAGQAAGEKEEEEAKEEETL